MMFLKVISKLCVITVIPGGHMFGDISACSTYNTTNHSTIPLTMEKIRCHHNNRMFICKEKFLNYYDNNYLIFKSV